MWSLFCLLGASTACGRILLVSYMPLAIKPNKIQIFVPVRLTYGCLVVACCLLYTTSGKTAKEAVEKARSELCLPKNTLRRARLRCATPKSQK